MKRKPPAREHPIPVYLYGRKRLCARCGPAMSTEQWAAVKRCTLPCDMAKHDTRPCTSPHPSPCHCDEHRKDPTRREWRALR